MIETIEALPRSQSARVLNGAKREDLSLIRASTGAEWIDINVLIRVDEAIASAKDPELVENLFHNLALADFRSGYLKAFIMGAIDLFGPSPGSFLKWVPRGWNTVFNEVGSIAATDVTAREARLVHTDLCLEMIGSDVWLIGHRAYFTGIFALAKKKGTVVVEERDIETRRLVLLFRW